jgi:hypothetical protein
MTRNKRQKAMMPRCLVDLAKQFGLENELALLVFLRRLVRLVVFPTDGLLALLAANVSYDMSTGGHVALARLAGCDVDDVLEQIRLSMLATEVLGNKSVSLG